MACNLSNLDDTILHVVSLIINFKENEMSNFEPQCKTKAQLHREWARVLEMCEETGFNPCKCWLFNKERNADLPPLLNDNFDVKSYEFAIALVEGKPVFRGDVLYWKNDGDKLDWDYYCQSWNWCNLSWNPPKPKTISLIDVPMPCAPFDKGHVLMLYFKSEEDAISFRTKLNEATK